MSEYGSPRKHIDALIQQLIAATNNKEIAGIIEEIGEFFDRDGYADVTTREEKRALDYLADSNFYGTPTQRKEKFLAALGKSATQSPEAPPPAPAPKSPEAPPKKPRFVEKLRAKVLAAREIGGRRKTQRRKSKKQLTKKRRTVKRV